MLALKVWMLIGLGYETIKINHGLFPLLLPFFTTDFLKGDICKNRYKHKDTSAKTHKQEHKLD